MILRSKENEKWDQKKIINKAYCSVKETKSIGILGHHGPLLNCKVMNSQACWCLLPHSPAYLMTSLVILQWGFCMLLSSTNLTTGNQWQWSPNWLQNITNSRIRAQWLPSNYIQVIYNILNTLVSECYMKVLSTVSI